MSRSHPTPERIANPSTRWLEWNAKHGHLKYWDKTEKKEVVVNLPFTFLLLDEVKSIRGWDAKSKSKIFSNEIRLFTQELTVKSWEGGTLLTGVYDKAKTEALNAFLHASCYIAMKVGGDYVLANVGFRKSALTVWLNFKKESGADLYESAICIKRYSEETSGGIVYRTPVFALTEVSDAAHQAALVLDKQLQAYFASYQTRDHDEQADAVKDAAPAAVTDMDIPF